MGTRYTPHYLTLLLSLLSCVIHAQTPVGPLPQTIPVELPMHTGHEASPITHDDKF